MNFRLANYPLRLQLVVLVATLLAAVSLFLLAFFPSKMESVSRRWIERRAVGMSEILANAVAPGFEFEDAESVTALLRGLEGSSDLLYAGVRKTDGSMLASWNFELIPPPKPIGDAPVVVFENQQLRLDTPITTRAGSRGILTVGFSLAELEADKEEQRQMVALVSLLVFLFGLAASFLVGTLLVKPIRTMTDVALRIARGDLSQPELGLERTDEIGQMANAFNDMLRLLRELAKSAERMGQGDFSANADLSGMVGDAFNRMREGQRTVVRQIAETSAQIAAAAAQIYAAAQEQEATAAAQSSGVTEVSSTMHSLLDSASHISDSARGVLSNAELTTRAADEMGRRISELSSHTNRIAEILEIIRDIADRSDLLALNASLEATRAGEMGRAFSLVALEMRRLAERVSASVQDVKTLVADIRSFGSSTVMTTEEGRRLAESTTGSARQITLLTQQQRSGTEQVSQSMSQITALLSQSVASAHQTRSAAETLKGQADRLADLVIKFRVDTGAPR
jgi:methyl-accepting chemotaxis protein